MILSSPILDDAIKALEDNYAKGNPKLEYKLDMTFDEPEAAYYFACVLEDQLNIQFEEEYGNIRIGIHKVEDDSYELRLHYNRGPHDEY